MNGMLVMMMEFLVLVTSFFVPVLLAQYLTPVGVSLLDSVPALVLYAVTGAAQFVFMCYVVETVQAGSLERARIYRIGLSTFVVAVGTAVALFVLALGVSAIIAMLPETARTALTGGVSWQLKKAALLPLIAIFCLVTGYREEFLFRFYLLDRLGGIGLPRAIVCIVAALFFAVLHLYEGIAGFILAALAGFWFTFIFVKTKNIHVIALGHALFNFFILVVTLFVAL